MTKRTQREYTTVATQAGRTPGLLLGKRRGALQVLARLRSFDGGCGAVGGRC